MKDKLCQIKLTIRIISYRRNKIFRNPLFKEIHFILKIKKNHLKIHKNLLNQKLFNTIKIKNFQVLLTISMKNKIIIILKLTK